MKIKLVLAGFLILCFVPSSVVAQDSDSDDATGTIEFTVNDRNGKDDDGDGKKGPDDNHNCAPKGKIRGPYTPDQAASTGTEGSFEAAAAIACKWKYGINKICSPEWPTGNLPQYVIHCAGKNSPAKGSMLVTLDEDFCNCEDPDEGEKQALAAERQMSSDAEFLDELEYLVGD